MSPSTTQPLPEIDNAEAARAALAHAGALGLRLKGGSMRPFLRSGDFLEVRPFPETAYRLGDVLLFESGAGRLLAHRLVGLQRAAGGGVRFLLQGDAARQADGWVKAEHILGRVIAFTRTPTAVGAHARHFRLDTLPARLGALCLALGLPLLKRLYGFVSPRHRL